MVFDMLLTSKRVREKTFWKTVGWTFVSASAFATGCTQEAPAAISNSGQPLFSSSYSFKHGEKPWAKLPEGRQWGATSAIYISNDKKHIWIAERCGANSCIDSEVDPILLFDLSGQVIREFGSGLFAWPHGIYVDRENNIWVTDAAGNKDKGHQVHKFSPQGLLLLSLGKAGIAGREDDALNAPTDVVVVDDGSIFVADGHGQDGNNRIVKFAPDGSYVLSWGDAGSGDGQFREPHALAVDSRGRIFVADRGNYRIQIFDQHGNFLDAWTNVGRPSGLFIDDNDFLYVADSESADAGADNISLGPRGIRIVDAKTGKLLFIIPDPKASPNFEGETGAEGVTVDGEGNIYAAEVAGRMVRKYERIYK